MVFESYRGEVSVSSTLCGMLRVCVNSSFSDILVALKQSCERIYTIDFSLSLEMKSPDILP